VTHVIRAARAADLDHLYEMAKLTGGGFTNLPPDRRALTAKLERAAAAFANSEDGDAEATKESGRDELFVLILEDAATGEVRGTCQIFTRVGQTWPFYSYRHATLTQHSKELGRTFRAEMLNLVTDLEGSSEVGGLFLHPGERAGGLGMLLARSRYLFIAMHRKRFADRILAELRGVIDERGGSPFWDGVAGRFFGMNFQDADYFNAINGNQFIADLMPKHPVYIAMLPETARSAIGLPHPSGRAAMRMLETEGFAAEGYIDIFDGGPTMTARTDRVRSIADAKMVPVTELRAADETATRALVATGRLADFRCTFARIMPDGAGIALDPDAAKTLGVGAGDTVWHVAR
jgi:arginine N-succinyltransferase